jgi:hypothetical protein
VIGAEFAFRERDRFLPVERSLAVATCLVKQPTLTISLLELG